MSVPGKHITTIHPRMDQAVIDGLLVTPWRTRWHFATGPNTSPDALEWFIRFDPEPLVSIGAIMNPATPWDVLELAAKQVDDCSRQEALANCPRQTAWGVSVLAGSGFADVRRAALLNPNCPDWVANALAVEDADDGVRRAAAFHKDLSPEVIARCARDGQAAVRMAVCERVPMVPIWVLERLTGDRDVLVRDAALRALGVMVTTGKR